MLNKQKANIEMFYETKPQLLLTFSIKMIKSMI